MSRITRQLEHLNSGFTAEATAAARYRAYAARAESEQMPNLGRHWRRLAVAKDQLAIRQLEAAEAVPGGTEALERAIADERYENEVLYPRMASELAPERAELVEKVLEQQRQHLAWMEALLRALTAARGDVEAPVED